MAIVGCSAFADPSGERDWLGTSTVSPAADVTEFTPPTSYREDYATAAACLGEHAIPVRSDAPTFDELHWFTTPDTVFYFAQPLPWQTGTRPITAAAFGHTITLSSTRVENHAIVQHEIAHLLSGQGDHADTFWVACGWVSGTTVG